MDAVLAIWGLTWETANPTLVGLRRIPESDRAAIRVCVCVRCVVAVWWRWGSRSHWMKRLWVNHFNEICDPGFLFMSINQCSQLDCFISATKNESHNLGALLPGEFYQCENRNNSYKDVQGIQMKSIIFSFLHHCWFEHICTNSNFLQQSIFPANTDSLYFSNS